MKKLFSLLAFTLLLTMAPTVLSGCDGLTEFSDFAVTADGLLSGPDTICINETESYVYKIAGGTASPTWSVNDGTGMGTLMTSPTVSPAVVKGDAVGNITVVATFSGGSSESKGVTVLASNHIQCLD